MTTFTAFVAAVSGLSITGVSKSFDHKPTGLQTADLPAQFVDWPDGGTNSATLASQCDGTGKRRSVDLVLPFEALNQEQPATNYSTALTLMDAVEEAIDEADIMPIIEYSTRVELVYVGDGPFMAVRVSITGIE